MCVCRRSGTGAPSAAEYRQHHVRGAENADGYRMPERHCECDAYVALSDRLWHDRTMDATLVLGQQGRIVIPADVRSALGLAPGDRLHLHIAGPRLVLQRQQDALAELRGMASDVPKTRSLVDELLAERRLAAAAE